PDAAGNEKVPERRRTSPRDLKTPYAIYAINSRKMIDFLFWRHPGEGQGPGFRTQSSGVECWMLARAGMTVGEGGKAYRFICWAKARTAASGPSGCSQTPATTAR